jgi:hypothetical protein
MEIRRTGVSLNLARSRGTAWFDEVRISGLSDEPSRIEYVFPKQLERNRASWMVSAPGQPPVIVEPIRATVRVPMPATATVYRLDPTGKRTEPIATTSTGGQLTIDLPDARTIWCELVAE